MINVKSVYGKNIDLYNTIMKSEYCYVFIKDRESRFLDLSLAQVRDFKCNSREEVIGKTDHDFFPGNIADESRQDEIRVIETGEPLLNKLEMLKWPNGEVSWVQVNKFPLYGENGEIVGTWGVSYNVTAIKDEKNRLEEVNSKLEDTGNFYKRQCVIDDMTELYNRRKFFDELNQEYEKLNELKGHEFCISFLDLDDFKSINDRFGHQFGDFIISKTAAIIRANVRSQDIVFRLGGDEFLVIYKQINKDGAMAIVDRVCTALRKTTFSRGGISTKLTISGGIASSSEAGNIDDLIHFADKRLYKAKAKGKDKIII